MSGFACPPGLPGSRGCGAKGTGRDLSISSPIPYEWVGGEALIEKLDISTYDVPLIFVRAVLHQIRQL